jgi:RTA1 like protein
VSSPRTRSLRGLSTSLTNSPRSSLAVSDPNNQWKYCPSYPAAITFAVLFGLTSCLHIFQAWHYRKSFCWVLIMGALWEFTSLVTRVISINDPTNKSVSQTTFVFLILAPMWINAFDYMVLGRMIYFYLPEKALARIPGRRLAVYFVCADITCVFPKFLQREVDQASLLPSRIADYFSRAL